MGVRFGPSRRLSAEELMLLNWGAGEDFWESLDCKQIKQVNVKGNQPWIFIGRTDTVAEALILWLLEVTSQLRKRPWCWERLKAGEGDNRGWDGWMASPTQWTWVWASSGGWWRTEEDEAAHLFSLLRERWEGRLTYLCNSLLWGWNWHPLHRSRASPGHSSSYPLPSSVL